jgi:hypothetical protein
MWNEPSQEQLAKIPKLYETEHIPLQDKLIYLHFFIGGCDWYIAETDGNDLFWGFVILNNDYQMAEWGYFSFNELRSIKSLGWIQIDNDLHWEVVPAIRVERIRKAMRWPEPNEIEKELDVLLRDTTAKCGKCGKRIKTNVHDDSIFCPGCGIITMKESAYAKDGQLQNPKGIV